MAYIGSIPAYQASGVRPRDEFTADGTQICFPLSQSVPGSFESSVTIVLDNVPQQPVEAFTVVDTRTLTLTSISGTFTVNETITGATSAATGTVLKVNLNNIVIRGLTGTFSSSEGITGGSSSATATTTNVTINEGSGILFSEAPTAASILYVVHEGNATYNLVPTAASVGPSQLADNLRNFTVDTFTGDGTTTTFTLSDTPSSANSLLVMVDGIVQTRTTNYTLSGAIVTFTDAPDSSAAITIIHLGFSTISRTGLVDGSVTTSKIADNAITSAKIAFDVIVAEDIAANAITVAEIANGAVTPAKLSTGHPNWDSSGNVGIGTSGPTQKLSVNGGLSFNSNITFTGNGYEIGKDGLDTLCFSGGSGGTRFINQSTATEWMRIFGDGRVAVNALATYDAGTTMTLGGGSTNVRNTSAQLAITRATVSTQYEGINFNSGPSRACFIGRPPNSDDLIIGWDAGSALAEGLRFPSPGGGIKFPATQVASADANTLDDYEEGTYTPSVTGSTSGGPFTFGTQSGYYTKIGREVKVSMFMSHNSTVTFAGAYKISLPFVVADFAGGGFVTYFASWISNSPKIFQIEANTTYGYLRMFSTSDQSSMFDLNSGLIQNNTSYMLTIIYKTT